MLYCKCFGSIIWQKPTYEVNACSDSKNIKDIIQTQNVAFFVKTINPEACINLDERPELAKAFPNAPQQICVRDWLCSDPNANKSSSALGRNGNTLSASNNGSSGRAGSDGSYCININIEDALRATNSNDIRSACALLELAANAKAWSVLVCTNQYRPSKEQLRSIYYGFPLIDTRILLQSIALPTGVDNPEDSLMVELLCV
jgi:hypothetical protein